LLNVAFQPLGQEPKTPRSRGCNSTVCSTLLKHIGSVVLNYKFANSLLCWYLHDCTVLTFGLGVSMVAAVMDFYCTTQMLGFMTTAPG